MNIIKTKILPFILAAFFSISSIANTIDSNLLTPSDAFTTTVWDASYLGQYRIPGLAQTKHNILLAFAEKRDYQGDQAGNDIVLRRSLDGGRTWGNEQAIYQLGLDALNNPTVVTTDNNLAAMVFNVYPDGYHMRTTLPIGSNKIKVLVMYSSDNGSSWTTPIDITAQVSPQDAYLTNIGPGNGFVVKNGIDAGRVIIASMAKYTQGYDMSDTRAVAVYNDQMNSFSAPGGHKITQAEALTLSQSWTHGGNQMLSQANEISMVEYGDVGKLYYMARMFPDNRTGGFRYDTSNDSGVTWDARNKSAVFFPYRTQSGLWRFDNSSDNTTTMVHTTPVGSYNYSKGRTDGRIVATRKLVGDSLTWTNSTTRTITNDFMSNTSITEINDPVYSDQQRIGVLYEGNTSLTENKVLFIKFSNINLDYVRSGAYYSRPTPY
jgi:sialidase-1